MVTQSDRVFDGFSTLTGGVNGGLSPSLINPNQLAFASNFTFRGGYAKTRAPYASKVLAFADSDTEDRFTGKFQGAVPYSSEFGDAGFVISRGGKLFRLVLGRQNVISEITPKLTLVTTAVFTVPAGGSTVLVSINTTSILSSGTTVFLDSGQYTIVSISGDDLLLQYVSGAANATVAAGTLVLDAAGNTQFEYGSNPALYDMIFMFQAESYVIVMGGQNSTIIYDGSSARRATVQEVPPGLLGIYLWGRIWVNLPDRRSFVAGDLIYSSSGTPQNGYRDAILEFTENNLLNGGGAFSVPRNSGPITAMSALATQDTSLGVGNLLVGTTNSVVSVNTPVDRAQWQATTYPIQTLSLIDYGPVSPRGAISVNGDLWYRSQDGIRSFIVARREITSWGNTPMSREISPILDLDAQNLLQYGSSIYFDNRFITTVSPYRTGIGIAHRGTVAINYDLISSMGSKSAPAWEGVLSGLNVLQLLKETINEQERAFAFVEHNGDVELWELLKSGYTDDYNANGAITRTRIESALETRSLDFATPTRLKELYTAEIYLDDLVDTVDLTIKFRPDQYPLWTEWKSVSLCATVSQCSPPSQSGFSCQVWKQDAKQYAARLVLPMPPETCNSLSKMLINRGYEFQFRIETTGHVRIRKFMVHAKVMSQPMQGECPADVDCSTIKDCGSQLFEYSSHS